MRWAYAARARLRLLLWREGGEQRMDEEFRFHLDMETERLVREAGVDPREARRRAHAAFGGVEAHKDAVRDGRGWAWLSGLRRDVRDGIRSLARRPAFAAVAVLSLALGIGANTAIFSLVNAMILHDSPVERPDEVVNLYLHQASFEFGTLSHPDFEDVRDGTVEVFSDIAASHFVPLTIDRGEGRGVGLAPAEAVTGSYFPMLGIEAAVGRTLLPSDDVSRGGHPVVMLDHRYWQSAFAGDPDVVGREMRVGGRAYTVIGVGPPDFAGTVRGLTPTFYVPFMMAEELNGFPLFDDRGHTSLFVKARLRPGVTLPQAEAAVGAVAARLTRDRIANWDPAGQFALLPLTDVLLFPPLDVFIRAAAWLLMVVVALVLLLACTNLASFLLARALDRRKEVAVRLALGASRGSLVRRLLTETTLLSLLAGVAGVGLAVWSLELLATADLPLPTPVTLDLRPDGNVLGFTFGVSVAAGALLGLVPALQSTRPDVAGALRSENAGGGQPGQLRWRNALVVAQLTISLGAAGRRHQQPAPEPAQPELERLQRRRVRAADRPRRLHRRPGRGRAGVLRGGRHRDRPRAQFQRRGPTGHPARGHRQ
jgi:predicted permease